MKSKNYDVIIVGAGAAGLLAASELLKKNKKLLLLEAKDRIGGRILSLRQGNWPLTIELGAEFLHGVPEQTLQLMRAFHQGFFDAIDNHLFLQKNKLVTYDNFFPQIEKVMKKLPDLSKKDQSVQEFLNQKKLKPPLSKIFPAFVEGFHAADPKKMSAQGLKKTEQSDENELNGVSMFRLSRGYLDLLEEIHHHNLSMDPDYLRLNTRVEKIQWKKNAVQLSARETFHAEKLILTVPLGVLKSSAQKSQIFWDPYPEDLRKALQGLEMGHVQRLVFEFKERFWENLSENEPISYLHAGPEEYFPTWWTLAPLRLPYLIAWQGGPRAQEMSLASESELIAKAFQSLSRLTQRSEKFLRSLLVKCNHHNWSRDPDILGAYSYVAKDGVKKAQILEKPLEKTIYFAGEACISDSHRGTVEGAFRSALRAVRGILQLPKKD